MARKKVQGYDARAIVNWLEDRGLSIPYGVEFGILGLPNPDGEFYVKSRIWSVDLLDRLDAFAASLRRIGIYAHVEQYKDCDCVYARIHTDGMPLPDTLI